METYLANLESHLREMLRDILENSRVAADNWEVDNPREIWLRGFAVQLALVYVFSNSELERISF